VPSEADYKYEVPEKYISNDNFLAWVNGKFPVDRLSDKLLNDKTQKYSAYNYFGTQGVLQNGLVLKAIRLLFGDTNMPTPVVDNHSNFNGVQTHENGVFLYQSKEANWALKWGYADWICVGLWSSWALFPTGNILLLPSLVSLAFVPRRWAQQRYFTWHAELLPHSEQVVLHKSFLFGAVSKHIVDIKNLEKMHAEAIPNQLVWSGNLFD
jgi:hypothetical protein